MKKIILTLGMIAACSYMQAQEISKEIKALENEAATKVKNAEGKEIQTLLTQLINGINPASLTKGRTSAELLSRLNTASTFTAYGSTLSSLANSLNSKSFTPGWQSVKASFCEKAPKAKSVSELAGLTSQLLSNLKPAALTSSLNKTELTNSLSLLK